MMHEFFKKKLSVKLVSFQILHNSILQAYLLHSGKQLLYKSTGLHTLIGTVLKVESYNRNHAHYMCSYAVL